MQNRTVASRIVHVVLRQLRRGPFHDRMRHRLPASKAHPGTLFLARVIDVEQPYPFAVLLQHVLDAAIHSQRLGPRQVNATILQLLAVKHGDRHEAAEFGFAFFARPLQHPDGSQLRGVILLDDLPRVLGECRKRDCQAKAGQKYVPSE